MFEEKRKLPRLHLQLNAVFQHNDADTGNCSFMDISRGGAGILFNTQSTIRNGEKITLLMGNVPNIAEARGTVVWTKELARGAIFNCAAGIKFMENAERNSDALFQYAMSQTQRYDKQWAEEKCLSRQTTTR